MFWLIRSNIRIRKDKDEDESLVEAVGAIVLHVFGTDGGQKDWTKRRDGGRVGQDIRNSVPRVTYRFSQKRTQAHDPAPNSILGVANARRAADCCCRAWRGAREWMKCGGGDRGSFSRQRWYCRQEINLSGGIGRTRIGGD